MLKSHLSGHTQHIANNYPGWSQIRQRWDSNGQIFLNPAGIAIEDLNRQLTTQLANYFIGTNNLDEFVISYRFALPKNYTFDFDTSNPERITPLAPQVKGFLTNGAQVNIQATSSNTIEDVWYLSLPDRISISDNVGKGTVLAATQLNALGTAALTLPTNPGRLLLSIANGSEFIQAEFNQQATVELQGITRKGTEEIERIFFVGNQSISTAKEWREIRKVTVRNVIPDTATLGIETFEFNRLFRVDSFTKYFDPFNKEQKNIQYHLDLITAGSVLEEHIPVSIDPGQIAQGISDTSIIKQYLMYNTSGLPISDLVDFCIQPFTQKIYAISSSKLYVFDLHQEYPNIKALRGRGAGSQTIIETNMDDVALGDTLKLSAVRLIPLRRVVKHEWFVTKPDGTKFRIASDGSEVSLSSAVAIMNPDYTSFTFAFNKVDYEIDQSGTYVFELKVTYHDNTFDLTKRAIISHYRKALKEFDLGALFSSAIGIAFDSDQKLWILDMYADEALQVELHKDLMLIDFQRKVLHFHEKYEKVEVEIPSG